MRIAVVGIHGAWSSEVLADAVGRATGERILVDLDRARLDLPGGRLLCPDQLGRPVDLCALDALCVKKVARSYSPEMLDRLEMLRIPAARGVRVFSDPARILRLVDRLACTVTLASVGVPLPPTTITEDPEQALDALRAYGRAILKPLFTSKARGMALVDAEALDAAELVRAVAGFQARNPVLYIQKALDLRGQDLGVCFLGGQYLGTYARRKEPDAQDDGPAAWNTSTASGGRYAPFEPPQDIIDLAWRAGAPFGLDFTCVDVALTADGPYVFEVSAFGGFRGLKAAHGIDVAEAFVAYALKELAG
ncbi:ribosomal protein S6--L-glutamate ligase [Humidesulfovibrio mexicanus]|uniref:Ribosomal protein S6--L-glutamate ligase n=1 Tax=Humidesulfovibrio mexicanus TaxID=147047 RepID=A0A239A2K1_9BACT|nr:GAK system ATP-grasp enzyme [Humidesulfovibrio mexicanus]SNR89865.1 ribosomal protein S6--L-glutamate ligase [Humidesulfovibrio mexicanus]